MLEHIVLMDANPRAVIGGVEYTVGGWGEYEVNRRRAAWEARGGAARADPARRPGAQYKGRTNIHASDAVQSVMSARHGRSALRRAALRLAGALAGLEERLHSDWGKEAQFLTIPPMTSEHLLEFANDPALEKNPVDLRELGADVLATAAAVGVDLPPLPRQRESQLPSHTVNASDDEEVLRLEEMVVPHISELESLQAALAAQLDTVASHILEDAAREDTGPSREDAGPAGEDEDAAGEDTDPAGEDTDPAGEDTDPAGEDTDPAGEDTGASKYKDVKKNAVSDMRNVLRDATREVERGNAARPSDDKRPSTLTRGAEVDAAAQAAPLELLEVGLSWHEGPRAFDLREPTRAEPTGPHDGIYFGIAGRSSAARSTLLTPETIATAAFKTSARVYAWFVLDSPEGCYALRADPQKDRAVKLDPDAIVAWLRTRLAGDPPHKIAIAEYVAHLRSLGLEVATGPPRGDGMVRFNLVDATTAGERARELAVLRALTPADFASLDWTAYDRDAAGESCRAAHEGAGGVIIVLGARTVSAPKVRPGTLWGVTPHKRSYITFHTHPAGRYQGGHAEPPSSADVLITLEGCALNAQAWAFVSAPEGTYIMRPSLALAEAFIRDPQAISNIVSGTYTDRIHACIGATAVCAAAAVRALEEVGFIAHLRGEPCVPLLGVPDVFPAWNQKSRKESQEVFKELVRSPAKSILEADWRDIDAECDAPTVRESTWLTAGLREGRAVLSGEGHYFGSASESGSYPSWVPGPVFVVFFPEEHEFPERVPHAALEAASKNAALWAWVVFLSPSRITVFRSGPDGVEIHGPTHRADALRV